jgi:GNAT superfamily N-acetyltransferase
MNAAQSCPDVAGAVKRSESGRGEQTLNVLRWEDEQRVASLLARAFVDDPLVAAICDAPAPVRLERMRWNFRVAVRGHCLAAQPGWTIVDSDARPVAVALVTRSQARVGVRSDILLALRCFFHIGLRTAARGLEAAQSIAAHLPSEPFTYLRTLGVDPDLQGRGLGSRLVERVLCAAPSALPVYLETAKERNLSFYGRHGFGCIGEFFCLGVPVWRLLRPGAA